MKKLFLLLGGCLSMMAMHAQTTGALDDYRRNSLATMMIYHSEDTFGTAIYQAFEAMPCPDRYDDHSFGYNVIYNDSIKGVQRKKAGLIKAKFGKVLSSKEVEKNAAALEKLLNDAHVGNLLVAKWFGFDFSNPETSSFNTELVQVRGQYNASDVDVEQAKLSARGLASLSDAGEELLGHTFVLVNDMTYVTEEEKAKWKKVGSTVGFALLAGVNALLGGSQESTQQIVDAAQKTNEYIDSFTGFTVKTHSYLFQLEWNDEVAAVFYDTYYTATPDYERALAFWNDTTHFRVKYVAHEYEYDGEKVVKGKYDREMICRISCTESMDKNIAALQLQYEDFKVKTPVYSIETNKRGKIVGYNAKIGMKEGISEDTKFQVIQRVEDPNTGRTSYRYVATVKPVKGQIWDNRYNAVLEQTDDAKLNFTSFKKVSGGEILPGMLLVEGKYSRAK